MKKNATLYGTLAALLALLIVLILGMFLKKNVVQERLENHNFYQYLSGIKFEYTGNLKIINDNNISELIFDDVKVVLDSTPLYYQDEVKSLLPKTMAIVYPLSNSSQYKINYFSRIYNENNTIYLLDGKNKQVLNNCFLYDGKDLYFFIEETKIKVNKRELIIPPLSYVVLNYNDNIQVYNYQEDFFEIIEIEDQEILATAKGYTINLSIDAVIYNNKSRLLIKNMDYLKKL